MEPDEQWKSMRQNLHALKNKQSQSEGMQICGLSQVCVSPHPVEQNSRQSHIIPSMA
jgi:hypothetical protein